MAIQAARWPDYDLTDRTPWCQKKTGCLGRVWGWRCIRIAPVASARPTALRSTEPSPDIGFEETHLGQARMQKAPRPEGRGAPSLVGYEVKS